MKLYICEKPSQAEGIAKILGNARKNGTHWETADGVVTWCFGHMLDMCEPDDYDPKWKDWDFSTLPILPESMRYVPGKKVGAQLTAIGGLLRRASEVVIATDPDRQGEAIGRNVTSHFKYTGPLRRLWLASTDAGSVRKALAKLKEGAETEPLWRVALALSEADWLVGMNGTRAVTAKFGGKSYTGIGRVQTPTLALIVFRDRAIRDFKVKDYYDLAAVVLPTGGAELTLRHAPPEEDRITDRALAEQITKAAKGQTVKLTFTEEPKSKAPPKLFNLTTLQGAANTRWDWDPKHTLDVAQSLYEKHGALSYPRTNCEFLQDDQKGDAPGICKNLTALPDFKHLAGTKFTPRKSIYDSAKVSAHAALTPTTEAPNLGGMSGDERKLYLMVAARFLASLLPDYDYLASKISTEIEGRGFHASGTVMVNPGWKSVDSDEEDEKEAKLPKIPDGTFATVAECKVEPKKTQPLAHYTAKTLLADMEGIARYVTNPEQKALLKSKEGKVGSEDRGIGTSATRGDIIAKLQRQATVELKGKQYWATDRGHALVEYLEAKLPSLVDLGGTAVQEAKLGEIADGTLTPAAFRQGIHEFVRSMIGVLGQRADAAGRGPGGAGQGTPTGIQIGGVEILKGVDAENENREFYVAAGAFKGRIYADRFGHKLTPDEVRRLVAGETLTVEDCAKKDGSPLGPKKLRYEAERKPWPDVAFVDETKRETTDVETAKKRGKGGAVTKCTTQAGKTYYTVEGIEAGGFPVKFWVEAFGRQWSAEDIAKVIEAGKDGAEFTDLGKASGEKYAGRLYYNGKKKPYAGLDFV